VNAIGGDMSCFFHGEMPGVDKLGEDNGITGDGISLTGRFCGDGRDGVGCGTAETLVFMSRFLFSAIVPDKSYPLLGVFTSDQAL
jgi:hypothetical protein